MTDATAMEHQDFKLLGMKLDARAHFNQLDTEAACAGGLWDWAVVQDGVSGAEVTPRAGGVKQGDAWTAWGHVPSGQVAVYFSSDNINCAPGDCSCQNGTTYPYSGAALKEVELRRYQSTNWYFPPLRFPGQYFDAETDLHENWNRFYDPQSGRYLAQEPLLQAPEYAQQSAEAGRTVASYRYTTENPVIQVDPSGLGTNMIITPLCHMETVPAADCLSGYARVYVCQVRSCLYVKTHVDKSGAYVDECLFPSPWSDPSTRTYRVSCLDRQPKKVVRVHRAGSSDGAERWLNAA